jgi:hypothetical protein
VAPAAKGKNVTIGFAACPLTYIKQVCALAAIDIEPNNQRRAEACQRDRAERNRTDLPNSPRFNAGCGNVRLSTGN